MIYFKRAWFWLVLFILALAAFLYGRSTLARIEVKGYEVKKNELVISVTGTSTGTIKADTEVKLTAQRVGRISRLYVEEGSLISAGAGIADLDYDEVRERLLLSSAQTRRMNSQLDALKLGLVAFRSEVESNINKTKAVFEEAELRLRRFEGLREKGFLSQIDVDIVKREYEVARASYSAARALPEQISAREEEIKAQSAAIEQAQREYNLSKIIFDYSFIKSPISGVVTARPVSIGETIQFGALIASIVSTDSLYVEAFIDEADVAKISNGQQVNITMDAYPEKVVKGEVYMISPVVLGGKQEARTFEVRVRILEKGILVKPGMSADVEVIVSRMNNVLIIPSQAIMEKADGRYVYVVHEGKAALRRIETGAFNWNFIEVTEGLEERSVIVINPDSAGLKNNARVRLVSTE
jgi:multidrug resistance efflux pump